MGRKMDVLGKTKNYTADNPGELISEKRIKFELPNPMGSGVIPSKVFLVESLGASGVEATFQIMSPNTDT